MIGCLWDIVKTKLLCWCVAQPKYNKRKKPRKWDFQYMCCCSQTNRRNWDPRYKRADEYAQYFLTGQDGSDLRRLMIKLNVDRHRVTKLFQLFMQIDVDDSGMVTLDEFFNYLRTDWSPFIGRAFHQMDSDQVGMSADQLSIDEWLIGLYNYCTLTPEALARFAFELYDDDGSEFISHDELETMIDDVFGKNFNKEDHVKQLISILDVDGDGVIEYDEWKKVAKKATSILQPAILLQNILQHKCMGSKFWDKEKTRAMMIVHSAGYPNVLQYLKNEVKGKKPDEEEHKLASKWLGEEVKPPKITREMDAGEQAALALKGLMKAKNFAKKAKINVQADKTQHGFKNPFRGGKNKDMSTYGAVKISGDEDFEFYDEGEEMIEYGDDLSAEQLAKIRKKPAPVEGKDGSLTYPNGVKVALPKTMGDEFKKEMEEKELTAAEIRAHRLQVMKYAKAKCDLEMNKYNLYENASEAEPLEKQKWQEPLSL